MVGICHRHPSEGSTALSEVVIGFGIWLRQLTRPFQRATSDCRRSLERFLRASQVHYPLTQQHNQRESGGDVNAYIWLLETKSLLFVQETISGDALVRRLT